jgi:hypothetical protein
LELPGKIPNALGIDGNVRTNGRTETTFATLGLIPTTGLIAA